MPRGRSRRFLHVDLTAGNIHTQAKLENLVLGWVANELER